MISVRIDVSKEKSTICILKPYGEIVSRPFEVCYTEKELSELASMLLRWNDDVRVVMEATGIPNTLPNRQYRKSHVELKAKLRCDEYLPVSSKIQKIAETENSLGFPTSLNPSFRHPSKNHPYSTQSLYSHLHIE